MRRAGGTKRCKKQERLKGQKTFLLYNFQKMERRRRGAALKGTVEKGDRKKMERGEEKGREMDSGDERI